MDNAARASTPNGAAPAGVPPAALAIVPQLGDDSFRRVVEWAPSAMVMIDRAGTMVMVNAQAERMFDYPREALIGQSIEILVPERFRGGHCVYRASYFDSPLPRPMGIGRDLAGCRADGSEFPIEIGLNPIATEAGVMVLASIIDITERRRAQQHLEDALREKTVLLNEVHHRVKNNLQVIISLLNLQADYAADPRFKAILSESCERVKAMALTHQLLYERKEFSGLDLGDYLDRLLRSIRSSYRAVGDRVGQRFEAPEMPVLLDLDRSISCGMLVNELVTNAYKHAFVGGRRGEIVVSVALDTEALIVLRVADDGVGLPPGIEAIGGTSLGLQLVRLFVEQLHGTLDVSRNGGTAVIIRFPKD
jgi:PAS domain S-box-containing protein